MELVALFIVILRGNCPKVRFLPKTMTIKTRYRGYNLYKMYNHKMKINKYVVAMLLLMSMATSGWAQSSMTDQAVMEYIITEHGKGTEQAQIVTKLMQRGVTIDQIRRVKKKLEQEQSKQNMGAKNLTTSPNNSRLRENNAKKKTDANQSSPYRIKDGREDLAKKKRTYNEQDADFMLMKRELSSFAPDSTEYYDELYLQEMMKGKKEVGRKVFGRDIFNNQNLSFEPNMNIATPDNYRLGPGDNVYVDVWGASQENFQSEISPDGTILIEGFGPISVAGMTVEEANNVVKRQLGARYSSSQVRLTVGQTKTIMVNVMGEVMAPGTYTLAAFATVFHALYMAGGTNEIGTLRNIKVYRNNKLISTVDIYDYMLNGKLKGNVKLADNDVIVVGPYDCLVNITGKVKRPMFYEMKGTESVKTLIDYAGGFRGDAYKKAVKLYRKAGDRYSVKNIEEFDMSGLRLSDEDSIYVDSVMARYADMAEVRGAVFRPGMYQLDGVVNSVKTLIQQADGMKEDAITAHGFIHRMREDRTLEVVRVDLAAIMSGRAPDVPLKSEDVLFVPSNMEQTEAQTITIHGEVVFPGVYKFAANETLEDFVLQAGGLTEAASLLKVDVARRIVDNKATEMSDTIAQTFTFTLNEGFGIDDKEPFVLQPFDEVYIRKSPGYWEQQNVMVEGEVNFSGTYTLTKKNERLSDIIKRAGGVSNMAYVKGARLERKVTDVERKRMEEVIKMQREQNQQVLMEQAMKSNRSMSDLMSSTKETDKEKYEIPESYPVGIELDKALANPGSDADLVLREGDRIIVPLYNGTVKVNGEVMYPNTVGYKEGKGVKYYINQAGGFGNKAKKSQTYIIYMNGDVAKVGYGTKVQPGCEIVVPAKSITKMTTTETVALASGTASIATMIATLVNLLK